MYIPDNNRSMSEYNKYSSLSSLSTTDFIFHACRLYTKTSKFYLPFVENENIIYVWEKCMPVTALYVGYCIALCSLPSPARWNGITKYPQLSKKEHNSMNVQYLNCSKREGGEVVRKLMLIISHFSGFCNTPKLSNKEAVMINFPY